MEISPQEEIAGRVFSWHNGHPRGPYTLELYPTLRCNLDCAFCDTTYRKKRAADELLPGRYLRLVEEAAELEVRRCYILGGGEPMIARETTPDIMVRLKSAGIYGILGTNGTLFYDDFLRKTVEIGWDEIHFSLDGATPEVNDTLRGQPGVWARVVEVLERLRRVRAERGSQVPRLLLHTVVTRVNYHQLEDMVSLAERLGCFRVNFDALIAYRPEQYRLMLTEEDRKRLPEIAAGGLDRAKKAGIETTLDQFLVSRTTERGQMTFPSHPVRDVLHAPCLNPWHHIVIQHNGRVSPCCVFPPEDGADDIRDRSLAEVWFEGSCFQALRRSLVEQKMIRHCQNCSMSIISQNETIRAYWDPQRPGGADEEVPSGDQMDVEERNVREEGAAESTLSIEAGGRP